MLYNKIAALIVFLFYFLLIANEFSYTKNKDRKYFMSFPIFKFFILAYLPITAWCKWENML